MMDNFQHNQSIRNNTDQLIRNYKVPINSNREEVLNTILSKIKEGEKVKISRFNKFDRSKLVGIAAAASVILVVTFYLFTASVTFKGVEDGNSVCLLPDGSRVVLKSEAGIKYKKYYWSRNVYLNGEAYFEIESGNKFRVRTNSGQVDVLGTRFLVAEIDKKMVVKCFEGNVKAVINKNSAVLNPGMMFSGMVADTKLEKLDNTKSYPDFARFNKSYSNVSLLKVVNELEYFFGKEIILNKNSERIFSGTISTGNLDNALNIVCMSMQLDYKKERNTIIITNQNKTK